MTGEHVPAGPIARRSAARAVSRPHDPREREADRAADVVGRGGSVAGWSFSNVPLSSSSAVHRQEAPKPKTEDEKFKEAALKAGEAALATPQGKALKEQVLADPLVKTVTDAVSTTPGKVVAGAAIVGGVGALAATGKSLPAQPPAIPLDRITPGLSAKVTYEGPVNAPTFVGLTLTYREQGPKAKAAKTDSIAADTARLRAQREMLRPKSERDAAKKAEQEMVDVWIRSQLPGLKAGVTIPLPTPTTPVEEEPVQRAPASESTSAAPQSHAHVDDAFASPGRPLDRSTRKAMEARFGYDFSRVRIHDDDRAARTAEGIDAAAFTVGRDIAFAGGRSGFSGPTDERVLAHELTHVVQQGPRGTAVQRKAEPANRSGSARDTWNDSTGSDLTVAPPVVHRVLRSKGLPLPQSARDLFEPRLGMDLGTVQVHADDASAESAAAVNAIAFTVGRHVVFGRGRYAPADSDGRRLLAHELTHVKQDGAVDARAEPLLIGGARDWEMAALDAGGRIGTANTGRADVLHRATGGFFSAIGGFFSSLAHLFVDFSPEKLNQYLANLARNDDIEGDPDSDDKARAIVKAWVADHTSFRLGPRLKTLLILELLDGPTTESDEEAIVGLLEGSNDADVRTIFAARGVNPRQLLSDVDNEAPRSRLQRFFGRRFVGGVSDVVAGRRDLRPFVNVKAMLPEEIDAFVRRHFAGPDRALALKVINDLLGVKQGEVDFENEEELRAEVFKRVRTSQLMQESQNSKMFDYPEALTPDCEGFDPTIPPDLSKHARVNKAARAHWNPAVSDPRIFYYFTLSPLGQQNPFEALRLLFTPQERLCDRTLIHCDYLTSVIQLRAFAESIGPAHFDDRVRRGAIVMALTYFGAEYVTAADQPSPRGRFVHPASRESVSLQVVRPASEEDLVIGDHVMFWNHLAYDALSVKKPGPWRLENAVLVDKNDRNQDIYEGHGAPWSGTRVEPGPKDKILGALLTQFNRLVEPAIDLTRQVEAGQQGAQQRLTDAFPQVERANSGWAVRELPKNSGRPRRFYELRQLIGDNDPELVGLRDELDPSKFGPVERPVESREKPL